MGTRYRFWTPDQAAPNDGAPPGLERPVAPMFAPPFSFPGCGPPPPPFGPFGPCGPPGFPAFCGLPPQQPTGPMACYPNAGPPPPSPFHFPVPSGPPPPYTPNPWGQPMPVHGPPVHTKQAEQPPRGARVNGELAKFGNGSGHIFPKDITEFHFCLDSFKPWERPFRQYRMQSYTAPSKMTIDEFIEQVGAIDKAPRGTPREYIGVQEAIDLGDGRWEEGKKTCLGMERIRYTQADGTEAFMTLEQLGWGPERGQAGRGKPVTLVMIP